MASLTLHTFYFYWFTLGIAAVSLFAAWFIRNLIIPWELQRRPEGFKRASGFWAIKRAGLEGAHITLWSFSKVLLIVSLLAFAFSVGNVGYMMSLLQSGQPVEWWVKK